MEKGRWEEGGRNIRGMNKKNVEGFCLFSCQFKIRVVDNATTYHSKKKDLEYGRNKLYYFELYKVYLHFCELFPPTLDIKYFS